MKALANGEVSYGQIRSCFEKKRYNTFRNGQDAISRMREAKVLRDNTIHVYLCDYCGGFHVGHEALEAVSDGN